MLRSAAVASSYMVLLMSLPTLEIQIALQHCYPLYETSLTIVRYNSIYL